MKNSPFSLNTNKNLSTDKNKTLVILLVCLGIILLIFVSIMVYINYMRYHQHVIQNFVEETLLDTSHHCMTNKSIKADKIPSSSLGNEYSLNFWLYISNYKTSYGDLKNVISKGVKGNMNPEILLDKTKNNLLINIKKQTDGEDSDDETESSPPPGEDTFIGTIDQPKPSDCIIKNIPLQRWVCINISLHNTTLDVYMDGKLYKTCLLDDFPKPNNGDMELGFMGDNKTNKGFDGYLSRITWANKNLSPEQIYDKYLEGPKIIEDPLDSLISSVGLD